MYISPDPIGLAGNNPTLYGYVHDSNGWVDRLGLSECNIEVSADKFEYLFGRVDSTPHNRARSRQLANVMKYLGIQETPDYKKLLTDHFIEAYKNPSNVSNTFTKTWDGGSGSFVVKESLFAGPSGKFAVFETTWEVFEDGSARLTTLIPKL